MTRDLKDGGQEVSTLNFKQSGQDVSGASKKKLSGFGEIDLETPRDRNGSFEPHITAKKYGVNVLAVRFVNRAGTPLIDGAVAYFVVRVVDVHLTGDHTLYIGTVEHFESRNDKPPLFYAGGYKQLRAEG